MNCPSEVPHADRMSDPVTVAAERPYRPPFLGGDWPWLVAVSSLIPGAIAPGVLLTLLTATIFDRDDINHRPDWARIVVGSGWITVVAAASIYAVRVFRAGYRVQVSRVQSTGPTPTGALSTAEKRKWHHYTLPFTVAATTVAIASTFSCVLTTTWWTPAVSDTERRIAVLCAVGGGAVSVSVGLLLGFHHWWSARPATRWQTGGSGGDDDEMALLDRTPPPAVVFELEDHQND